MAFERDRLAVDQYVRVAFLDHAVVVAADRAQAAVALSITSENGVNGIEEIDIART